MKLGHAPGPSGIPLLGVWHQFRRDPQGFLKDVASRFGDISSFRVSGQRVYFVNRPDLIEEVLVHNSAHFERITSIGGVRLADDLDTDIGEGIASAAERTADRARQSVREWLEPARALSPKDLEGVSHLATSAGVVWNSLKLLAAHPATQEQLRAELRQLSGRPPQAADVPHLSFSAQIVAETLRLHPPAWAVGRVTRREYRLFNFLLQAGTICIASPAVMHSNAALWPHPETFDPTRFEEAAERGRAQYAFFPFGGSSGKTSSAENLCWVESVLVLATLCQNGAVHANDRSGDRLTVIAC